MAFRPRVRVSLPLVVALSLLGTHSDAAPPDELGTPSAAESPDDEVLLEFHLTPVDNLQIAIWLEDADGNFVQDIFVTQATGKLGIANRPGDFLFLSSWRAPYGARESVLPIWAHRRGKTYPKIVFHDANVSNWTSLGFHESSSSPETYFCRPLTPTEDNNIIDTMTCPSPATFQSDKGEFGDGFAPSVYPPRNDLTSFDEDDHPTHPQMFAALNDLDAVTRATPSAGAYMVAQRIRRGDVPEGPLVAWIEASLEWDENEDWEFDREDDHWVDPKLAAYGREFLGQPAVVYRVEFDPNVEGFVSVSEYVGYADFDGQTGTLHAPDASISSAGGSGADRLQLRSMFGQSGRFGVYSHGWEVAGGDGDGDTSGDPTGDPTGGGCQDITLPPVANLRIEPSAYDTATATFTIPELPDGTELSRLIAWAKTPEVEVLDPSSATEAMGIPAFCREAGEVDCIDAGPGDEVSIDVPQLFGNYSYTIGVAYEDACTNRSGIAQADITTPVQPFQTLEGQCFVATAAWGAGWTEEVRALRWFRDSFLLDDAIGGALVASYYAYGPVFAKLIAPVPAARATARVMLRPIASIARDLSQLRARLEPEVAG
jgi:hypothetical protein